MTANEILASEGKKWHDSDNLVVDVGDFKGGDFDAPEIALSKTDQGIYNLNLDPTTARDLGDDKKNTDVVKSLYYQYKLAEKAYQKGGISHYIINGKHIVAFRDFAIPYEGTGQKTTRKSVADYLKWYDIVTGDAGGEPRGRVLKGLRSNFIIIGLKKENKPPPYNVWKAAMKAKFKTAADILPAK